jgi:hypothetical protein
MKSHLNSVGVFLTLVGAFLIWRVVAELNVVNESDYLKGQTTIDAQTRLQATLENLKHASGCREKELPS